MVVVGGGGVAAVQTVPDVAPVSMSQRATTGTQLTLQTLHLLCTHAHTHTCTRTHTHAHAHARTHTHTHTHTRLTTLCPGLSRRAGTRKVEPIWILLEQETVSGSGIYWAICKSAPRSRQITAPAPHHSVFTGWMPFLPPIQQRQSTAWI